MPPKKDAAKGLEPDEVLQAVVVTDSFNSRFKPLTKDEPRCLLPLANVPLIEYTLEFLAVSGVQEVFVVCCAHSDKIKEYLRSSKWNKSVLPRVTTIVSQELMSMGDALREMDAKSLLHSDFILVSGDIIANFNLEHALEEHRQRRQVDKNAIMTMVLKQATPQHRTRAKGEESLFILNAQTRECLRYESMEPYPLKRKTLLSTELFEKHPEVDIRNDLIDCQIDICNIEVPALFTENFDYQEMRKDFVRGILESDLLGKTIYTHILESQYAARVSTPQMYDSVSKDILCRWSYPLVPDANLLEGQSYQYSSPHIYRETNVNLSRSARLERRVAVGSGTRVGDRTRIANSTIGRNCKIGANVTIDGAYVWDGVTIGDNCRISRSIVGSGVTLKDGAVVQTGCLISSDVVIGANKTLPPNSRVALSGDADDSLSDTSGGMEAGLVGDDGRGVKWVEEEDEDEDDDLDRRNVELGFIGHTYLPELDDDDESEDESDEEMEEGADDWKREVQQTLARAISENHSIDIAALELNTLKMAMNITFQNLRETVLPALLQQVDVAKPASINAVFKQWAKLVSRFTHGEEDQANVLSVLQHECLENEDHAKVFVHILKAVYEHDVVEEDVLIKWHKSLKGETGTLGKLRDAATPLINWLQEADEESDEDDDEDEDDE
ncbi:hypothetical protein HK097_008293 [Rhizophlyctis rosea]|uniref:Translation initiation factor eIF2B subunit epsilon n=1 Tax=Rhizophlyctis rosea TaxID=64517 RepID=A0AAD5X8H6_9FUNG|nr:hypothetical protein HK097_008293 [Rhizophlyctis rosea]